MDSTTLTRTLRLLLRRRWIRSKRGSDKRERLFSLTGVGKRQIAAAQPHWEAAERRLHNQLGNVGWKHMRQTVSRITEAALIS